MKVRTIKFCPECESEFPSDRGECPEDGSELVEYEVVDKEGRDALTGVVLGDRFRIEEPISQGAMGKIYRGTQTGVDRDVAVKVLRSEAAKDETKVRRFHREARAISQLAHPHIVNFIDFGQDADEGVLYLVMEMIEGCDIAELLRDGRLAPSLVVELSIQVCLALSEPHRDGVVHRDLKPANLMVQNRADGSLHLKLVDFGIANVIDRHDQTQLTRTGVACGTPYYMAPEQADTRTVSPRSDLYALGTIMFRMLTGRVPFDAGTDVQVLMKHLREEPPQLHDFAGTAEIPTKLMDLVHWTLEKEPERRPESVLQLRDRLGEVRESTGLEAIQVDPDRSIAAALERWVHPEKLGRRESAEDIPQTGDAVTAPSTGETQSQTEGLVPASARVEETGEPEAPRATATAPSSSTETVEASPPESAETVVMSQTEVGGSPEEASPGRSTEVRTEREREAVDGAGLPGWLKVGFALSFGAGFGIIAVLLFTGSDSRSPGPNGDRKEGNAPVAADEAPDPADRPAESTGGNDVETSAGREESTGSDDNSAGEDESSGASTGESAPIEENERVGAQAEGDTDRDDSAGSAEGGSDPDEHSTDGPSREPSTETESGSTGRDGVGNEPSTSNPAGGPAGGQQGGSAGSGGKENESKGENEESQDAGTTFEPVTP